MGADGATPGNAVRLVMREALQQQGRLADTGIAADQQRRADDQSAAADAIELVDAALVARRLRRRSGETGELEQLFKDKGVTLAKAA